MGPAGLEWESYNKIEVQGSSVIFFFLVIPLLIDLTHPVEYEYPVRFRAKMRYPIKR
jgi:hypothetical protein